MFSSLSSVGCIVFASNILVAAGHEVTTWNERGIAVAVILSITLIHGLVPRHGVRLMNLLAIFKIVLLLLVVVSGWVVLAGGIKSIPDPKANFRNGFAGTTSSAYFWASGLFKVINSFSGWSNATYVLGEVRQPRLSFSPQFLTDLNAHSITGETTDSNDSHRWTSRIGTLRCSLPPRQYLVLCCRQRQGP